MMLGMEIHHEVMLEMDTRREVVLQVETRHGAVSQMPWMKTRGTWVLARMQLLTQPPMRQLTQVREPGPRVAVARHELV